MLNWNIEFTDEFARALKRYQKKRPNELSAVLNNLDTYFETLKLVGTPLQVKAGFIHNEPNGIIAVDQKGGGQKGTLKQTRLYVFPDTEKGILHLLTIGDKQSQKQDIKNCREKVIRIKRGNYE